MLIILFFSTGSGWLVSWLCWRILFLSPIKNKLVTKAGKAMQDKISTLPLMEKLTGGPASFDKLKPDIERHVDVFLNEKLATVFPLLYKFMGEKTILQFKHAFMIETDLLFPVIIRKYITGLTTELRIDALLEKEMSRISPKAFRKAIYHVVKKEFLYVRLLGLGSGFLIGVITIIALHISQ